jgi:hypothetical protein
MAPLNSDFERVLGRLSGPAKVKFAQMVIGKMTRKERQKLVDWIVETYPEELQSFTKRI